MRDTYQLAARMMGASTETTVVAPTRGQAAERDRSEPEADREYSNCLRDSGLGAQRKQVTHTFSAGCRFCSTDTAVSFCSASWMSITR
jgi:hypothetical protein